MAMQCSSDAGTVVQQVADNIRSRITRQRMKDNTPLPSYRELARELGVSYVSVKLAMDVLVADGIVRRQKGQGCFVNQARSRQPRALTHLGLIYPSSSSALLFGYAYLSEIMTGISQATPSGGDMHIFPMRNEGMVGAAHLAEWDVDGAILLGVENDDYLRAFASWGTLGVVVDYCPGADIPLDYVACDNAGAARRMVEHLAGLGHRRVAYISPYSRSMVYNPHDLQRVLLVKDSSDVRERRDESLRALRERGMLVAEFCPADEGAWPARVAATVAQWMLRPDRPTALLTDTRFTAAALSEALERRKIRLPEDVTLCAVADGTTPSMFKCPRPACCRFDFTEMGRKAIDLLVARCREPGLGERRVHRIGFEFIDGETKA